MYHPQSLFKQKLYNMRYIHNDPFMIQRGWATFSSKMLNSMLKAIERVFNEAKSYHIANPTKYYTTETSVYIKLYT